MRHIHNAFIASAVLGAAALIASAAHAQYYAPDYVPYAQPHSGKKVQKKF